MFSNDPVRPKDPARLCRDLLPPLGSQTRHPVQKHKVKFGA